ncbi:MAG TPA: LssY C-terminal domain-containing protein [Pirellulales bacterium]
MTDSSPPRPALSPAELAAVPASAEHARQHHLSRFAARGLAAFILLYFVVAYLGMPAFWRWYIDEHPTFADVPNVTHTKTGVPGDPLNISLVVDENGLPALMTAAGWRRADPLSLKHDLEIAEASVLGRPYAAAPVSDLYLFGRKEDAAFEQPVGNNPRKRHHVRFWKTGEKSETGRPVWIGSAVFDEHVGLSRETGQITHVTAPNVDEERDKLMADLKATGELQETYFVDGFHKVLFGRNGGGDPWRTDGRLAVGIENLDASNLAPTPSAK